MKKEILINTSLNEIRVAITENGRLAELFWELPEKERHVGNIYVGRVQRIVQGMNAAFVDIGEEQDAFLHFSDAGDLPEEQEDDNDDDDDDRNGDISGLASTIRDEELSEAAAVALRRRNVASSQYLPTFFTKRVGEVTIGLEVGQYVMVQVTRESYGSKGLRVTTKISIPGRYLVLLPFASSIGVSKKIWDFKERKRLRAMAKSILPSDVGCIVRTEAAEHDDEVLKKDLQDLVLKWRRVEEGVRDVDGEPALLHKDVSLARSLIRDILTADVMHVIVDSEQLYRDLRQYVEWAAPQMAHKIKYYAAKEPIFEAFGLQTEIERATSRTVPLPFGGYLVWDYTEAMTVVDVNSGRFAADREQENNALRINIEAAREVARQIRLRDIGGMVVVDCIDMASEQNRRRVVEEIYRSTRADRAQVTVYPITQLGLLQITRKRVRQNILQVVNQTCPTCNGTGVIPSSSTIVSGIERWLKRFVMTTRTLKTPEPKPLTKNNNKNKHQKPQPQTQHQTTVQNVPSQEREFVLVLKVHPTVAHDLSSGAVSKIARMMFKYFVKIRVQQDEHLRHDEFRFFSPRRKRDITDEY
jgi:ribonuclease G